MPGSHSRGRPRPYLPFVHQEAETTLSAAAFGRALAGAANEFGGSAKIVNVHCVRGDPGRCATLRDAVNSLV